MINKNKIDGLLLWLTFFLSFLGYYTILLLIFNAGMSNHSRLFTVPLRIIILIVLSCLFLNEKKLQFSWQSKLFIIFACIYVGRIYVDYLSSEFYFMPSSELLFYFVSFSLIPFIVLSTYRISDRGLISISNALFISGFMFSFLSVISYQQFIGQVQRLSANTSGEEVLSPLALSYCSTLIIGVFTVYMFNNKTPKWQKILGITSIIMSSVPFFLGASRGSLFALFVPFLFIIITKRDFRLRLKSFILLIVFILTFIFLDEAIESGLLNRVLSISKDINEGNSSAIRTTIWKSSWNQFLNNPFLGDKLRVNNWDGYPHNIILEVLQTMGIIGFIPFVILIFNSLRSSFKLFKYFPQYSWIAVIFLQAFIQFMFSGAIYAATWLWIPMALLISVEKLLKKKKYIIRWGMNKTNNCFYY